MNYTLDQFHLANSLKFCVSFSCYGKVHTESYGTGIAFVQSEVGWRNQDSITRESLFKMFVDERRKKHYVMYLDELGNAATSMEIIIEVLGD